MLRYCITKYKNKNSIWKSIPSILISLKLIFALNWLLLQNIHVPPLYPISQAPNASRLSQAYKAKPTGTSSVIARTKLCSWRCDNLFIRLITQFIRFCSGKFAPSAHRDRDWATYVIQCLLDCTAPVLSGLNKLC